MLRELFRVVTFDITGTILRLRFPVGEIYASAGRRFGIEADPKILTDNFKKSWSQMNQSHPNYGLLNIGWEEWWKKLVFMSFEGTYDKFSAESSRDMKKVAESLIDTFKTEEGWMLTEGSMELLNFLAMNKITVGVISNFDVRLHKILYSMNINEYFKFVVTSYESSFLKPNAQIFRFAEKECEQVTGEQFDRKLALHVGDNYELDYSGAVSAGWNAALISKKGGSNAIYSSIVPKLVFKNTTELGDYFESCK